MSFGSTRAGLRGRLLFLFLLALLPALLANLFSTLEQRRQLRAEAASTAMSLAQVLAARLEGTLHSTAQLLRVLETHPAVVSGAACDAALDRYLEATEGYTGLAVVNDEGFFRCSSPRSPSGARVRPEVFARIVRADDLIITGVRIGVLSGKRALLVARVLRENGVLRGAVMAGIDVAYLDQIASGIALPAGSSIVILDEDGLDLAAFPDLAAVMGHDGVRAPAFQDILSSGPRPGVVESTGLDDARRLFGYAPIEAGGSRFFVAVGMGVDELMAPAASLLGRNLTGLALAAALAIALALAGGHVFLRRPIAEMLTTTRAIAAGDLSARVASRHARGELGELAGAINAMAEALEGHEARVAALSRRLLDVQEGERRALARELHDEIGQGLTAVKLVLQALNHGATARSEQLTECIAIADRTLQQLRSLSLDLRPPMLDHLGLAATLRWYVARESERAGFEATCRIEPPDLRLDTPLETTLFRIAQEALTNVARHAGATRVTVALVARSDRVRLTVQDNGRGFDVNGARARARAGGSLGLLGMEERAVLAGGALHVRSGSAGTEVRADMPVSTGTSPGASS